MRLLCVLVVSLFLLSSPALAQQRCPGNKNKQAAMWLSIAHPGVGEYYLKGWGPFSNMPPRKFWLGFIPFYGWPGYLQYKSATDALNCKTNDDLTFRE